MHSSYHYLPVQSRSQKARFQIKNSITSARENYVRQTTKKNKKLIREKTKLQNIVEAMKNQKWTPYVKKRNQGKQKIREQKQRQNFIENINLYQEVQTRSS